MVSYEFIGYMGSATFGHAADGTPTISGAQNEVVLAQGNLISGSLAFNASGGVSGNLDATVQVGGYTVGALDVSVQHSAGDIRHTALGGITLSGGAIHAIFVPAG